MQTEGVFYDPPEEETLLLWNLQVGSLAVDRSNCQDCELLKDYYWLKVNRFLLTLRSFSRPHVVGAPPRADIDEEIKEAKQEALRALRALITHLKSCYELDREVAA